MKLLNRRDFLALSSIMGFSTLLPKYGFANTKSEGFFFLIQVDGGMDVTLGLDPKIHTKETDQKDIFIEYRDSDILKKGGISLAPAAAALIKHANDISILNGIVMRRDIGHDSLLDYISSGKGDMSSPYISVEYAQHTRQLPLGILVNSDMISGKYSPTISQIRSFIKEQDMDDSVNLSFLEKAFSKENELKDVRQRLVSFERNKKIFFETLNDITTSAGLEKTEISVIAAAFASNNSSSAFLSLGEIQDLDFDLDTHAGHEGNHSSDQQLVWEKISEIFDTFKGIPFKGGSLFDSTTFMVVSEFSRTPFLNGAKGKDHNVLTNSVLLAGRGIIGNQVIGGSHVISRKKREDGMAIHMGSPIDYKTGQVVLSSTGTGLIFPENLIKSLHKLVGKDEGEFYKDLAGIPTIPGLIKI